MESILSQNRISLSKAAQISGYHQDYLGQLCRLGKLKAAKIGRNWYTTESELQSLVNIEEASESSQQIESQIEQVSLPVVSPSYIVSQVEDMPIQLEYAPQVSKSHHTLQTLIMRMKLEQLKTDVLQVTGLIGEISEEVNNHSEILKRHELLLQNRKVDLKNSYSPSLSFTQSTKPVVSTIEFTQESSLNNQPSSRLVWLWPVLAVLLAVVVSGLFMISINSSSSQPQLTTVIYKTPPVATTELDPQVAGDQTEVQPQVQTGFIEETEIPN